MDNLGNVSNDYSRLVGDLIELCESFVLDQKYRDRLNGLVEKLDKVQARLDGFAQGKAE